jgi:hypothetical protein
VAPGPIDTASGDSEIEVSVGALTVTTAELAADETTPDAVSVASIVAVAPTVALATRVTTPAELTVATPVLDDLNVSPDAGSALVDSSL